MFQELPVFCAQRLCLHYIKYHKVLVCGMHLRHKFICSGLLKSSEEDMMLVMVWFGLVWFVFLVCISVHLHLL